MNYRLSDLARICEGRLMGEDLVIDKFITDSRRIHLAVRSLFIAIKGPHHDGHHYQKDAYKQGVRSFLLSSEPNETPAGAGYILVEDTLLAFHRIAASHRARFSYPVIGITGSYGKTETKELLTQLLEGHFHPIRSPKSYNSQTGVPLSVMAMDAGHDLAIFEAGISESGEMERLESIINPDIGIFTSIGSAHDEGFDTRRDKISEKALLFSQSQVVIYPRDDESIHEVFVSQKNTSQERILAHWGSHSDSFLHILEKRTTDQGVEVSYCTGGKTHSLLLPAKRAHDLSNLMTCITTCHILGLSPDDIQMALNEHRDDRSDAEFIQTPYGNGLMVEMGQIDGPRLRLAKEQLASITGAQSMSVILCHDVHSAAGNDRRMAELREELEGDHVICLGPGWDTLISLMPRGITHLSNEDFFDCTSELIETGRPILLLGPWSPLLSRVKSHLQSKGHQTELTIDLASLSHNLSVYRSLLAPQTKLMAMVKAFAYGSGDAEVARVLAYHQVDYLAVAYTDEGIALRRAGIEVPIMVMNCAQEEFQSLIRFRLEPELYSSELIDAFIRHCSQYGVDAYPVHLKVDTGMHRLGLSTEEAKEAITGLVDASQVKIQSIFTHLYASDGEDLTSAREQIALFEGFRAEIASLIHEPVLYHALNTAGISRIPEAQMDMVRLGIGLYGYSGDPELARQLRPVLSWHTSISQVKVIAEGDTVGYTGKYRSDRARRIAVLPVGYADGVFRSAGNGKGHVIIHGRKCPFIGNICMDMSMVDIGELACKAGDRVELIGEHISLETVADYLGTIPYEVLTSIPHRIKRRYIFKG